MDEVTTVLNKYAQLFGDRYKEQLTSYGYTEMASSVTTTAYQNSNQYGIEMKLNDYWQWIEYGRQPGKFPPVDKMISWVQRRIPSPTPIQVGSRQVIPTPNQLAFLVGRKIAREGLEGKHLLQKTIEELQEQFLDELIQAIKADFIKQLLS